MDLAAVEEVIHLAQLSGDERKVAATRMLDTLRTTEDRWDIGLQLFFKAGTDTGKFFGLSLVREYLDSSVAVDTRKAIREAMMEWIKNIIIIPETQANSKEIMPPRPPVYLINNVVSIVTLCVKHDFPEIWPSAFDEILELGNSCISGLDLTVRILSDLDVEVVTSFSDGGTAASSAAPAENNSQATRRQKEEQMHNTAIKDAMRAGDITRNIVHLLCKSAVYLRSDTTLHASRGTGTCNALSRRCLRCMSLFIGWIDVNLVISETLSTLYQSLQDGVLCAPALACLYELVKKGMDPLVKVYMINSIDIVPMLTRVPLGEIDPTEANFADDEDEDRHVFELGMTIDMIALELIGVWSKYEELVLGDGKGAPPKAPSTQDEAGRIHDVAPIAGRMLHSIVPLLIQVFGSDDSDIANTVLPALGKLVGVLKIQKANSERLPSAMAAFIAAQPSSASSSPKSGTNETAAVQDSVPYLQILDYFPSILGTIYRQIQYPADFEYDANDENDAEIMEAKKAVRKVFVNCCRIHPGPCLELIQAVFQSLPSPISTAPVAPLEAAIQLAYAFAECGPQYITAHVEQGAFPILINALHSTDIAKHQHSYVLLAYFDATVRYLRIANLQSLDRIASVLTGERGLRHPDLQVRCRAAYCLLRVTEGLEPKAFLLLSHVNTFADIILNTGQVIGYADGGSRPQIQQSLLTESAELHLLEATSLIARPKQLSALTSVVPGKEWDKVPQVSGSQEEQEEQQRQLQQRQLTVLHELSNVLVKQVQEFLAHTDINRYGNELAEATAHKISCLASLAKGLTARLHAEHTSLFQHAAIAVVSACHSFGAYAVVRAKTVIFLHRMVAMLGSGVLDLLGHMYPALLQYSDSTDTDHVVQVLNQATVEFQSQCGALTDAVFGLTCDKYDELLQRFEAAQMENRWIAEQSSNATLAGLGIANNNNQDAVTEAPHIDLERASLQRQYIAFLSHICTQGCEVILLSPANQHRLEGMLAHFLRAIRGEGVAVALPNAYSNANVASAASSKASEVPRISVQAGLVMRKSAIASLLGLCKAWEPAALQDAQRANNLPPQIVHAFRNFMFEQALPLCLGGIATGYTVEGGSRPPAEVSLNSSARERMPTFSSSGSNGNGIDNNSEGESVPGLRLNLADAQTQNIVLEVGCVLHQVILAYGKEDVISYLQQALPVFGWGHSSIQALLSLIMEPSPSGTGTGSLIQIVPFKESFKKIFRTCRQ